jgi:hypothetical protein
MTRFYFGSLGIAAISLCWHFRADIREWWDQIRPWELERDGSVNARMRRKFDDEGWSGEEIANAHLLCAAKALLEVARVEQQIQMYGYTKATAAKLGPEAESAYLTGGVPGLNNWRRAKREAAMAKAEGRA